MTPGPPQTTKPPGSRDLDALASDAVVIAVVGAPTYEITVWRPPAFREGTVKRDAVERWMRRALDERPGLPVIEPARGDEVHLIVERIVGARVTQVRHLAVAAGQLESYTRGRREGVEEATFADLLADRCEGGET